MVVGIACQHRFESMNNGYDKLAYEIEYAGLSRRASANSRMHAAAQNALACWSEVSLQEGVEARLAIRPTHAGLGLATSMLERTPMASKCWSRKRRAARWPARCKQVEEVEIGLRACSTPFSRVLKPPRWMRWMLSRR